MQADLESTFLSRTLASTETLELADIHSISAFYTPIEERFERITRIARRALRVRVAAVTAVSFDSQWFKSVAGWNVDELRLRDGLCSQTIIKGKRIIIPDLSKHPRYSMHHLVIKSPKFRFYAGVPLRNANDTIIGTFCVMDTRPRKFTPLDRQVLEDFGELAQREMLTIALHDAQTQLISKLSIARRQALLDPLTKTWNRRGGALLLDAGLELAKKKGTSLAVCAVDINDFKAVNDTFGHATGDRALRLVARELLSCVRRNDGVCRYGGDEFFVMLVGASLADVEHIADRFAKRIRRAAIKVKDDRLAKVSICTGIKFAEFEQTETAEQILEEADQALYRNKIDHGCQIDTSVI